MKKTIVITGGSSGIGESICNHLSQDDDYEVINLSRNKNINKKIFNIKCDVSNYTNVKNAFKKIKKIDILINNAGITKYSSNIILNFEKIIKTNLISAFYCGNEAYKKFNIKGDSRIINIGSINAYLGFPKNQGYVASKGALVSLTRAMAVDFVKKKTNVNSISPGYIKTKMTIDSFQNSNEKKKRLDRMIIKRWGKPEDLFGVVELLISKKSQYITGQDFVVDGGWTVKGL